MLIDNTQKNLMSKGAPCTVMARGGSPLFAT